MSKPKHITIVGAGLVGSLLAVYLNRRGYKVSVFEKRADMRKSNVSAGRSINLALAQRGIHALEQAGLMNDVLPLLIPMKGRMLHEIGSQPEFFPYGQREHEVIYSVSRGGLNNMMMTAAESNSDTEFFFEHELVDVDLKNDHLKFVDLGVGKERSVSFDFLIGADGGGSQVRSELMEACGGKCSAEMLDHDYKELEIPADKDGGFLIDKNSLHIWPRGGFMLIALPNLDGSFTVTLFMPTRGETSFEQISKNNVASFFEEVFPSAAKLMPELETDFCLNPTGDLGTIRCYPWVHDNAMILGDAAHAIVPFHGQGMNCGFEDCAKLDRLLNEFDDDWTRAADEFQKTRKPNADAIADMALENYVIMRDSVSDDLFQKKKVLGFELERRFPRRFIPRYSMVMFHDIPYHDAIQRGLIQDEIMSGLLKGKDDPLDVDYEAAETLIVEKLSELTFAF